MNVLVQEHQTLIMNEQIEKFWLYLQKCFMHTLRHFSFGSSTPNNQYDLQILIARIFLVPRKLYLLTFKQYNLAIYTIANTINYFRFTTDNTF